MSDYTISRPVTRVRTRAIAPQDKTTASEPAPLPQRSFGTYVDPRSLIRSRKRLRTPNKSQQEHLQRNLRRFGCVLPVVVDERSNIISGHGLVEAALAIGLDQVPIVLVGGA